MSRYFQHLAQDWNFEDRSSSKIEPINWEWKYEKNSADQVWVCQQTRKHARGYRWNERKWQASSAQIACKIPKTAPMEMNGKGGISDRKKCLTRCFPVKTWSRLGEELDWRRGKGRLRREDLEIYCCIMSDFVLPGCWKHPELKFKSGEEMANAKGAPVVFAFCFFMERNRLGVEGNLWWGENKERITVCNT